MSTSKHNSLLVMMSGFLMVTFLIFVTALKSDNVLRIALAAGGFLVFCGMYLGLLVAKKRAAKAS